MVKMAHRDQEERLPRQSTGPPRVLVADDDGDLRRMIVQELCAVGYEVAEARTGVELLDHISEALLSGKRSAQPDVIVSDIRMPGIFGLGILEGLRDQNWRTGMVVMTAYPDGETRKQVAGLGAAAFFEKPFKIDDLLRAVRYVDPGRRRLGGPAGPWVPPRIRSR
jgi:CheY-like chemotaxis protein